LPSKPARKKKNASNSKRGQGEQTQVKMNEAELLAFQQLYSIIRLYEALYFGYVKIYRAG
jgi:hypothetical protein